MSALAALALLLTGACKEACLRHLTDARLKATVCGRCFTQADRGAWAASLGGYEKEVPLAQLEGLLDDDDWAVRWGGIKSLAARKAQTESSVLSEWIDRSPTVKACATAVHVAGARHLTAAALIRPASAAACWERRQSVRNMMEIGLYDLNLGTRLESLEHLSAYFETVPARIMLDAMKSRTPETDVLTASVLKEGAAPAGKALLEVPKTQGDEERVNRLLAVYAKEIDTLRPKLRDPDVPTRREAIHALGELAPLSAPELEGALDDADTSNRRSAALALARGEGVPLAAYARRKLEPSTRPETSIKWLGFIGASREHDCAGVIDEALRDERLATAVRAAALPALVDCLGVRALPTLTRTLDSSAPELRAGAVRALEALPRVPEVPQLLERRLSDADPRVLVAAAHAAAAAREKRLLPALVRLADHPDAPVRAEAVTAISGMDAVSAVPLLARLLGADADREVRLACARGLGQLGGPGALPSLVTASESDKDAKVKFVAAESLRKLGFQRSAGSMSP